MTTPVTSLVTLDDVKAHLNITDNTQDAELTGFISAATAYVQNLTGPIIPQTYTEFRDGGAPYIFLDNVPVMSVQSVTEYVGLTAYTLTASVIGNSGAYGFVVINPAMGKVARLYSGGIVGPFVGGSQNISITYTAGQSAVSGDIRMAVLQDIAGIYQPSQLGGRPGLDGSEYAGNGPLNPIGMFPRVMEVLSAAAMRLPAIG